MRFCGKGRQTMTLDILLRLRDATVMRALHVYCCALCSHGVPVHRYVAS